MTTLDDLSVVEVAFSVPEQHLARLAPGQAARLASPAYPGEPFLGRISAIDTRVDQTTRSIALRAEVPNGDGRLAGGMFMRVSLVLAEQETAAVPERALTVSGDQAFIYVARDGIARRVDVVTGAQRGEMIGVTSDLPEGAAVIVSNLHSVRDGTEVEATTARRASAAGPGE
ncbi:efflux RND transporter periplasmic adaptor subunit [Amaricoccus sp. W119]|uniref:efflux RND transporter periplasmic adaptor subunit n=1 Tax=Amaricoccus sp. W119 TaxID=3391833 RepID=UPI0039A4FAC8